MPSVSCRCRFPSFLYRVYQPTLRRAEASPRACAASSRARGDAVRVIGIMKRVFEFSRSRRKSSASPPPQFSLTSFLRLSRSRFGRREYLRYRRVLERLEN